MQLCLSPQQWHHGLVYIAAAYGCSHICDSYFASKACSCVTKQYVFTCAPALTGMMSYRTELDKIVAACGCTDPDCRYMALAVHPESLW